MRKKEPELNKQLIIEAAIDIGYETDWGQVTFQAIAEKTGLSKGGIIHHFNNKEALLDELVFQSFEELTFWIQDFQIKNHNTDAAMAYLFSVVKAKKNQWYHKTMRIILQAILFDSKYRDQWKIWYKHHIMPENHAEWSMKSEMIFLIADGIWYNEHMGVKKLSKSEKENLLNYITQLK